MPSERYNEGIYSDLRRTKAKVTFSLVAPEAKEQVALTTEYEHEFSHGVQTVNSIRELSGKYATFEPDYWQLDGSFILPLPKEQSTAEVGYWSSFMSDGQGYLPNPVSILARFEQVQDIPVLGISFDSASGETAADFEVYLRDVNGETVYSQQFKDNSDAYVTTDDGSTNVLEVELIITRTLNPYRFLRVAELDFGLVLTFDSDRLLNLSMIREADRFGEGFPVNELKFTITNDGSFDQLDETSLAAYLNKRQTAEYSHGLCDGDAVVEWIYGGAYYLDNWSVSESKVEFTALGKASALDEGIYYESTLESMSVGDMIRKVAEEAGFDVSVPQSLEDSPMVRGYFGNIDYRKVLVHLARLSGCLVYEDRNNGLMFKDILAGGTVSDSMTFNNIFAKPVLKMGAYYNGINLVEKSIYTVEEKLGELELNLTGSAEFVIYYSKPCQSNPVVTAEGFTLSDLQYSTMYVKGKISGNGAATITVIGDGVRFNSVESFYPAPWHSGKETDYAFKIELPMMISGASGYEEFREWFLQRQFEVLRKRITSDVNWRQNPAQEIGDLVELQTNSQGRRTQMHSYRENVDYSRGVLSGSTCVIADGFVV